MTNPIEKLRELSAKWRKGSDRHREDSKDKDWARSVAWRDLGLANALATCADELDAALSDLAAIKPDGYHYVYKGDVIRKNSGDKVNGSLPIGAIPYYYAPVVAANEQKEAGVKIDGDALVALRAKLRGRAGPFTAQPGERYVDYETALSAVQDYIAAIMREQKEAGGQDANPAIDGPPAFKGLDADAERCSPNSTMSDALPGEDELIDLFDRVHEEEWFRYADESPHSIDRATDHATRMALRTVAPRLAQQPARGGEVASLIVRDCCEAESADPERDDTVCIRLSDLEQIAERHTTAVAQPRTEKPEGKPSAWLFDRMHVVQFSDQEKGIEGRVEWCPDCRIGYPHELLKHQWARNVRPLYTGASPRTEHDDGPDVSDGHDHEGFPGGCKRFGHTPENCPTQPLADVVVDEAIEKLRLLRKKLSLIGYDNWVGAESARWVGEVGNQIEDILSALTAALNPEKE